MPKPHPVANPGVDDPAPSTRAKGATAKTAEARTAEAKTEKAKTEKAGPAKPTNLVTASGESDSASTLTWPRFRGPTGMGVSNAKLPTKWGADENIAWKTPLPGSGTSSPIVVGDKVFVTCYTGYLVPGESGGSLDDLKRHLLCLSAKDGAEQWRKTVKAKLPEPERIRDHGYAGNTPAADAKHLYVFYGKTGVIAYDHAGNEKWRADVGDGTHGWGSATSPVIHKDMLYINASVESESLIALNRNTGKEKWRARGIKESWNTPLIVKTTDGKEELVLAKHGKVLGFDPDSGKELWSCDTDITWYMVPSVVAEDGIVYVLGGRSGFAGLAVKTGGRGDVTGTHRLWKTRDGSNVTSPVYHDGHLYWMHESKGVAYCAKAKTGEVVYQERLDRGGQVYASSLLAGGHVYHINRSGRTFVLAAKPSYELISTNDLRDGSRFDASPAVLGNRLLIRSGKFLYCIGK